MDDLSAWKASARQHKGISLKLAEFIATLRPDDVPIASQTILWHALVDA